jgi:hypothetical protein
VKTARSLARRSVAATAVVLLTVLVVSTAAEAAEPENQVEGVVVHGGNGEPVPGLDVTLLRRDDDEASEVDLVVTDADGRFLLDGIAPSVDHEVLVTYDGADYRRSVPAATGGERPLVEVEVFEGTDAADDVVVTSWVVWVDRGQAVTIQQDLQVENRGERTYLGEPGAAGQRTVISVPLSPGATGVRFLGRFTECCATMRGADYVHTSALPPGVAAGTVRYSVASFDGLTLPVRLPVETFTLMVPAGVSVGASQLELTGEVVSQGNTYDVYTAPSLERGDVLEVTFRGLQGGTARTWPLLAAALAALAGLAAAGAAAVGWRGRRRSPAAATALDPDLLVEELALLDLGFERGLIPREVYEPLRTARKAELVELPSRTEG